MWSRGMRLIFLYKKPKNSHVIWPFMHSCIKSIATRESGLSVGATQRRLTALIAEVIKPINVVLCAACHWLDGALSFCWASHEPSETEKKNVNSSVPLFFMLIWRWNDLHADHRASTQEALGSVALCILVTPTPPSSSSSSWLGGSWRRLEFPD